MPNILRQELRELASTDGSFVMLGAILLCRQTSIGTLVGDFGIGEADGVAADGIRCFTCRQYQHRSRVNTATQDKPKRNIADHVESFRNDEDNYPAQCFNTGFSHVFLDVNDCFCIALSSKNVAAAQQILTKLLIVVDFDVETNVEVAVLIRKRLVPAAEVNDGKATK